MLWTWHIFLCIMFSVIVLPVSTEQTYISMNTSVLFRGSIMAIIVKKFGGSSEARELGLPVTDSGLVLPCGASCRWER